jgi:hypothetical protein
MKDGETVADGIFFLQAPLLSLVFQDLLYPPDPAVFQPHLDPMRMVAGRRKNVFDNPGSTSAGSLILLQNNFHPRTGPNISSLTPIHNPIFLNEHSIPQ